LAREAAANDVDVLEIVLSDVADILEPFSVRVVIFEHGSAKRIDLDLPHDAPQPGSLEPKLETAHA
jgi:hypothetical protein